MRRGVRWRFAAALLAAFILPGCGGGDAGSSSAPAKAGNNSGATFSEGSAGSASAINVQAITVNSGVTGQFPNMVMTSVTICAPGSSACQTIPNIQVDTGSSGLRLLASTVTLPLPAVVSADSGAAYGECVAFADGVAWGSLAIADVKLGGESAASMSVQVIQDNGVGPAIPASCSAQGIPEDSLALLGANGILGVGPLLQDCGDYCAGTADAIYYLCPAGSSCVEATLPTAGQVGNPAAFLAQDNIAQDNNGVILQLPAIPATGASSASGSMVFGIGTRANNALTAAVIAVSDGVNAGSFSAVYGGATLTGGVFDSGSSGLYFDDAGIPTCTQSTTAGDLSGFFCPGTETALSLVPINVTIIGSNGVSVLITANVANALFLVTQPGAANLSVFNDLAGPAGSMLPDAFVFGAPFFFGRSVYTAFEQRSTPSGAGPYFAFQAYP